MREITLTVLLLCAAYGLQPLTINYSPEEACALKDSILVLKCSYVLPAGDRFSAGFWYRNDSKIPIPQPNNQNGNRFVYTSQVCLLRIINLTAQDSGFYQYKITSQKSTTPLSTPGGVTVHVADVPRKGCWGVSYSSISFCVLRGSTVEISCSYGYPKDEALSTSFWFKEVEKQKDPLDLRLRSGYEGRVEYLSPEEDKSTVRIRDMTETDSGKYRFRYTTDKPGGAFSGKSVSVSVTDLQVSLSSGTVTVGGNVTLTCSTSCNLRGSTTFIWYKNTHPTRHRGTTNTLHLNPVSSEDAGNYSCSVRGHEQYQSDEKTLNIIYAPRNTMVITDSHAEQVEATSVSLTCISDANPPVHNYTWYRKIGDEFIFIGAGPSYAIINITYETRGVYYCVAHNSVGEQHSAVMSLPIAGQSSAKATAIGFLIVGALLLGLCLLWIRKRKLRNSEIKQSTKQISQEADSCPVYDDVAAAATTSDLVQRGSTEASADIQYASVKYKSTESAEVEPYSNVQHHQTSETQEDVQYASVKFCRPKDTSKAEVDPVIYSAVKKPPRKRIRC